MSKNTDLARQGRSPLNRLLRAYGLAILFTALTLGFRLALDAPLEGRPTLVIFTLPILFSAYLGGLGPGLLATLLSTMAASFYLLPPLQNFTVISSADRWQQFFLVLAGVCISAFSEALHKMRQRASLAYIRELSALKEKEHLRAALDEHAIVAMTDGKGKITFVNDKFCAISQYSRQELIGQDHRIVNSGHHDKPFIGELWATIRKGQVWHGELKNRAKDGSFYWVDTTIVPFLDERGQARQYVAIRADITQRKLAQESLLNAERALHASDRRLANILQGMNEACFAVDAEWRFTFVNDRGQVLLRHRREEMLGRTLWEVFDKLLGTPMEVHYRRAMSERVAVSFEAFSPIAQRWLDIRLFPSEDGLAAFLLDIHARKLGEEALKETRARLDSALEAGAIGTWTWDIPNDRLVSDEVTARLFSVDKEEAAQGLPAQAYIRAILPADQGAVTQALDQAIQSCGRYDIEYRLPLPDGSLRWIQARGRVDGNAAQQPVLFHGAVMDITERKRSEARFRRLVDSNAQGVLFWSTEGKITDANDAFLDLVGYTRSDLKSGELNWARMTPPEYADLDERNLKELALTGICTPTEKEYTRKDGTRVAVLIGAAVFDDNPSEGVCFVLDISQARQAHLEIQRLNLQLEERVRERTAQLESANEELESFSYSVSHDLRAPLRAIDGFSQAILEDYAALLPPEGQECLDIIRNRTKRMGMLIDDLLAFSRLSRLPITRREVDMESLVNSVLDDLLAEQPERKLDLQVASLPSCQGDHALLRQVWVNLLSNAFKYTRQRAPAVIQIGCEEGVYFVRDNGAGFDMRYLDKLFGVFQRLHREEEFSGTGVGLAIVKRIVHRLGGTVWAEGAVDQGATFSFRMETAG